MLHLLLFSLLAIITESFMSTDSHLVRVLGFDHKFLITGKPYITSVYPTEGWTSGGTKVCIVGMNFFEGLEVVFGTLQASAEVCAV